MVIFLNIFFSVLVNLIVNLNTSYFCNGPPILQIVLGKTDFTEAVTWRQTPILAPFLAAAAAAL